MFFLLFFSVAGISMHKGYAFVQFANAFDARSACLGEDKRMVLGQQLGKLVFPRNQHIFIFLNSDRCSLICWLQM